MMSDLGGARHSAAARSRIEERLAGIGLPAAAVDTIAACVAAARLWPAESDEVAEELASHFREGLTRGRSVEELASEFRPTDVAARLIGRGVRRLRPAAWHFRRGVAVSLGALLAVFSGAYLTSWARLHRGRPASAAYETDGPAAVLQSWTLSTSALRDVKARGASSLAKARLAAQQGDRTGAVSELAVAIAAAEEMENVPKPAYELGAIVLAEQSAAMARDLSRERRGVLTAQDVAAVSGRLRAFCGQPPCWRPSTIRAAFEQLLSAMYTEDGRGDGHLTAEGLHVFQAWKGKTEPGFGALLLEPAYFWRPASRRELVLEFNRLLALAETAQDGAFSRELRRFETSPDLRLRYVTLEIPLQHLRSALARSEALERRIAEGLSSAEPSPLPSRRS